MTPEVALTKLAYILGKNDWDLRKKRKVSDLCKKRKVSDFIRNTCIRNVLNSRKKRRVSYFRKKYKVSTVNSARVRTSRTA